MHESGFSPGRFFDYLKRKKTLIPLAAMLALGVVLILWGRDGGAVVPTAADVTFEETDTETALEEKLSALLEQVGGVSDVTAMVTLASGKRTVFAEKREVRVTEGVREEQNEPVLCGSGASQTPVSTGEEPPRVLGVAVVCRGGERDDVKLTLTRMICALFGIGSDAVCVAGAGT